jgi:hypothetical protein
MLLPGDEFPHEPPGPVPPGWQENWYLLGWDAERGAGFSLHLGRVVAEQRFVARACGLAGGEVAAAAIDAPLGAELKAPGLEIDVDPFRAWTVSFDGPDEQGRPLAFDLVIESLLPPVDWREALASLMAPGTERDHYEVGGRVNGRLTIGAHTVEVSGLAVRDHTWGVRGYGGLDEAWWTPMCFAEPEPAYFTGASVRYGDRWIGTSIAVDAVGPRVLPAHTVEVTDGSAGPAGYRSVLVRAASETVRATVAAHAHAPYPEWAPGFWLNDAFCTVDWDGRRGVGIVELNRMER